MSLSVPSFSLDQAYKWGYLGQFAVQKIETWQADSSTGNTPMAIKNFVPMATHSWNGKSGQKSF